MTVKILSEKTLHPTPDPLNRSIQNGVEGHDEPSIPAFSLMVGSTDFNNILSTIANLCDTIEDDIEDAYPCTAAQEGLVVLSAKSPHMYVARYVYRLEVGITFDQFRAAWNATVNAHTILRTRIVQLGSQGVLQAVLRSGIGCQKSGSLQQYLIEDCKKEMGLGAPLARAGFIQNADSTSPAHFVITLHHALYDDWSLALIMKHLEAVISGNMVSDQSFSRFAAYCLHAFNEKSENFWRSELTRMAPTSFPALPAEAYVPKATKSFIHITNLNQWKDFDNLSTTVALSWAILVSRYTASEEVVFGLTDTGRRAIMPGVESMSGPTISTFPMQVLVQGDESIGDAWKKLHHRREEMVPYEQFGLNRIRKLSSEHTDSCNFQSLIVLQPKRYDGYSVFSEVTQTQDLENHATFGTYPITLVVEPSGNKVSVQAVYDHYIIPEVQMKRILQQHSHIMKCISRAKHSRVAEIEGLCPEDRMDLRKWNGIRAPGNVQLCAQELISEVSRSQPDVTAICAWDGEFSYGRLEALSSGFALQLSESGHARPDMIIPLYFEKSKWVAVAILGVIKAGAAFVLLDPATPSMRLKTICEDAQAPFVVCPPELAYNAKSLTGSTMVIDTDDSHTNGLADRAHQYIPSNVSPSNILYVVYTSGSTGKPKGVVIEHGAFCSSALAYIEAVGMDRETRALQFASYSFDVSVTDHLATLLAGGTVCIPSPDDRMNDIISVVNRFNINYADFTPSFLRALRPEDMPCLRTIAVGGEALSRAVIDIWGNHVRLINVYGPAECCVLTTIQLQVTLDSDPLNIGFGTGAVCWIADSNDHNRLVPIGAIGELLIGGPIVGRGYLNDTEKTTAAFVDTPGFLRNMLTLLSHKRVYKTGDLVQYASDGSIRFLGRKDMQVKLRGQRIELGEIEYCLNQSLDVAGLVVDVIKPRSSTGMLVAFILRDQVDNFESKDILSDPDDDFQSSIIQAEVQLRCQLPGYMVPCLFFQLTRMPTTASGKIDRKLLRDHAASLSLEDLQRYAAAKQEKRFPSTQQESDMHELVVSLLGLKPEAVGMDDTLFSLGGDSITAMRLAGLAMDKGRELTVAQIFAHPKLCDMALVMQKPSQRSALKKYRPFSLIENSKFEENNSIRHEAMHQCNVMSEALEDIYPCTALQEGMMFLSIANAGTYQCRYLYAIPPEMTEKELEEAWKRVTESNTILRSRLFQAGSRLYQAVIRGDHVVWDKPNDLEDYITTDAQRQVGLGEQLVRMAISPATSNGCRVWVLSLHHSLCDAWTVRKFLEQTAAAYRGQTLRPRHFSSFIEYVVENDGDKSKDFWRAELANLDPRAGAFPPVPSARYSPQAGGSLTYPVMNLTGKNNGHTLTTVIRLAVASVISRFTGSRDVVVGVTSSGRLASLAGIATITGPTLASYPMRIQVHPSQKVEAALREIQTTSIRALEFEHYGLQHIRNISEDTARACQLQTYLNILPVEQLQAPEPFVSQEDSASRVEFGGFALAMTCFLEQQNKGFTVQANYDTGVISHDELITFFFQVQQVVRQIQSDESITLDQIHVENPKSGIKEQLLPSSESANGIFSKFSDNSEEASMHTSSLGLSDCSNKAPFTEQECQIQQLVATTLSLDPKTVWMNSNFFDLGGDSITAMRLATIARREGLALNVKEIFSYPVLSDLLDQSIRIMDPRNDNRNGDRVTMTKVNCKRAENYADLLAKLPAKISKEITEILPTTEFQRMTLAQFYPRYIWISLPENLDEAQLLHACQQILQHHPILRSAFAINSDGDFKEVVQFIMGKLDIQLIRHDSVPDLTEFCAQDSFKMAVPTDGQPPFQAHLITLQGDSQRKLVLRVPHAQFDGLSIAVVCGDLATAYNGKPLPPAASFADHISRVEAKRTVEAYALWRRVLQGAKMTSLVNLGLRDDPASLPGRSTEDSNRDRKDPVMLLAAKQIPLLKPQSGITMATVAKTAWGLTLAGLSEADQNFGKKEEFSQEIVFGQVVHGRNLDIEGEDRMVGPCLNIIPVRMHISPTDRNESNDNLALLLQVQRQHIETMPFENLGLQEIIKHSTSWPSSTEFGSFVRFQNMDEEDPCVMDGVSCETSMYALPNRPSSTANVLVLVTKTGLEAIMTVSDENMDQKYADGIVESFCGFMQGLCVDAARNDSK
ncbi:hypothetical protein N7481_012519 [Penicillium waksmanii]|uniref:uncharacterized protein n=1 Tax=Penicillium waksmanii TaxID=69791 RepID=UPI002548F4EE|nr:uncharacterized protein N7481_012519 [Penicillium waksmanii]KAJ5965805.1 hypothetical protein N7481_012519 [Penicillium waksmanii]